MAYLTPLLGVPWRVSDSNGDPAVSYAYFYEAGTTAPKTVYSDAGLSSAHPSPLPSDAAGVFPAIYASAGSFKIDVQDSEGASLPGFPLDNVALDTFGAITATFFQVNPGTGAGGAVAVNADLAEDSEYQWKADNVVRWKATRQDSNPDRLTIDAFDSGGAFTGTTLDLRSDGRVLNRDAKNIGAPYIGTTWAYVTGSRAAGTSYQNTTGYPLPVYVYGISSDGTSKFLQVSSDNSTWINVGTFLPSSGFSANTYTVVKAGHYYRVSSGTSFSVWAEGAV